MPSASSPVDKPSKPRLTPARPAGAEEGEAYLPRIPWRWVLLGTISVATVIGGQMLSSRKKADALRSQIVQVHEQQLAEPARRYLAFRGKLESWIAAAASRTPDSYADKRLRITGLRSGKGLYLRLPAKDAGSAKGIAKAAKVMEGDLVASCLGLVPASARGLWEKGEFLTPEWLASVRKDEGVMQLRVTDEVLARHIKADLPAVLHMLRSDWFLLALEQGPSRRTDPVDVFLWDLRSGDQLLRGRVQPSGVLLSARIASAGSTQRQALPTDPHGGAADDCSLAAQIKQLAGIPAVSVENMPGVPAAPNAATKSSPTAPAAPAAPAKPTPLAEDETPVVDAPPTAP
jgi:hypothetical protein